MLNSIRKWFWTKVAEWKYRNHEYDEVCCCGNGFVTKYHTYFLVGDDKTVTDKYLGCPDYYCISRCAKEYAVTSYVEEKLKSSKEKMKNV